MEPLAILLPDPEVLKLKDVVVDPENHRLDITVAAASPSAICPCCNQPSECIHSRSLRTLADLPWAGCAVRLLLHVRRWFCDHADCPRRIFAERLPSIVAPRGRRTKRLSLAQQRISLALGGAAGARLSTDLAMSAGIDLLRTLARRAPVSTPPPSLHGGIDDWAKRKAHRYGSIIVDLDTHRPITLLDDRSADQVADWLSAHPEIEVVSRDRGQVSIEGATRGAPQAVQVADRWHLIKNLGEALLQVLQKHHRALEQALRPLPSADTRSSNPIVPDSAEAVPPSTAAERLQSPADQRRQARYAAIHELHQRGWSQRAIAEHLHLECKTVRTYLRMGEVVTPRQQPSRHSRLDPYKPYVLERWNAGCHNAMQLLGELQAKGFAGKRSVVRAFLTQLRKTQGLPPRSRSTPGGRATDPTCRAPSARSLTWLVRKRKEKLREDESKLLTKLFEVHTDIQAAVALTQAFATMVRERAAERLEGWMAAAEASGLRPFRAFAMGVKQDEAAIRAALSLAWSQGPVEGNINRLKLLKRQMYGRAKLDLLQQRFLAR